MLQSRTFREGSVGLFAILGLILFGGLAIWLRGEAWGKQTYQLIAEFTDVSGLQLGSPVKFRGVGIGKVVNLQPRSNAVDVTLEINSTSLLIPVDSTIQANRYGLIGEASLDITPSKKLPAKAESLSPISADCAKQKLILCHNDRLIGEAGSQLISSLTKLSNVYSDPVFLGNLNKAAQNVAKAGARIANMSDEVAILSKSVRSEIQGISDTTDAITGTANNASQLVRNLNTVISENRQSLTKAINESSQLISTINGLMVENRGNINRSIKSVEKTSEQVGILAKNLNTTVTQVNTGLANVNTQQIAKNLETLIANATETSTNLRDITKTLNDPTTLLTLQKTLDSARATFENAQKITADLDELTGDPTIRNNIRKLINGLSSLVSSTEQLEQQVKTEQVMKSMSQQLTYQIDLTQRLHPFYSSLSPTPPTPFVPLVKTSTNPEFPQP